MGITRKQLVIVAVLLVGALLVVLNQTLLSPALPVIMREMGIDATTVQWLTSGYSMVEAVVIPLNAYLLGRFPIRKLFILGVSLFAAGSLLAACAPAFIFLLLGRMLQAAATGVIMPMVFTCIVLIFPRERRGGAMGIVGLVIGFAPAIGPTLSGVLLDAIGWRAIFVIVTVLALITIVLASFALDNYGNFEPTTFDKPSVFLCSCGLLSLLYGLSSITSSQNLTIPLVLIVVGVILLFFFVRRQFKLEVPLLRIQVLKTRNFAVTVSMVSTVQAGLIGIGVLLPIYIQTVRGFTALDTGLVMLPGAVLGAIVGLIAGRLFDRFGARRLVLPGSVLLVIASIGLTMLDMNSDLIMICAVYTLLAIAMQFIVNPINTWGINSLDNRVIQHANALSSTLLQVGGSLGTALLVSISATSAFLYPEVPQPEQTYLGDHLAFIVTACIMVVFLLAAIFLVHDRKVGASRAIQGEMGAMPLDLNPQISVGAAMNKEPFFVRDTDTIRVVAQIMAQQKTSGLPIINEAGSVVGYISDGDIMKYIGRTDQTVLDATMMLYQINDRETYAQRVAKLIDMNVMQIATKNVISVEKRTPLEDVCQVFAKRRIKKVPVVSDGKLVGTISRADIIRSTMANLAYVEKLAQRDASEYSPEIA